MRKKSRHAVSRCIGCEYETLYKLVSPRARCPRCDCLMLKCKEVSKTQAIWHKIKYWVGPVVIALLVFLSQLKPKWVKEKEKEVKQLEKETAKAEKEAAGSETAYREAVAEHDRQIEEVINSAPVEQAPVQDRPDFDNATNAWAYLQSVLQKLRGSD